MNDPGIGVDASGRTAKDPSPNVLDLVEAATQRQDDLRDMESAHLRELLGLRGEHYKDLRVAETARIDAIRAVDVGAVNRAAEVAATQATTLATQVAVSAETLRTQVAAAASAATIALAAALEPVQKDIQELRRNMYENQGGKMEKVETSVGSRGTVMAAIAGSAVLVSLLSVAAAVVIALTH